MHITDQLRNFAQLHVNHDLTLSKMTWSVLLQLRNPKLKKKNELVIK